MKSELGRLNHELQAQNETIKDNEKKIKQNKTLPYLVSNIIEVSDWTIVSHVSDLIFYL